MKIKNKQTRWKKPVLEYWQNLKVDNAMVCTFSSYLAVEIMTASYFFFVHDLIQIS